MKRKIPNQAYESFEKWLKKYPYKNLKDLLDKAEKNRNPPLTDKEKAEIKKNKEISNEAKQLSLILDKAWCYADDLRIDTSEVADAVSDAHDNAIRLKDMLEPPPPGHRSDVSKGCVTDEWNELRSNVGYARGQIKVVFRQIKEAEKTFGDIYEELTKIQQQIKGRK